MWKNLICNIFKHSKVLLDLLNCSSEVASVKKNICSSKTKSYLRDKTWLKSLILSSVAIFKRMLEYNVKPFIFLKAQAFVCLFLCGSWYFQIWHQLQSPNWLHNSDSKHFLHQSFKTTNASVSTLFYSIFFCFCLKWEKCNVWPPHDCPVGGEVCRNSWITETVVQQEREGVFPRETFYAATANFPPIWKLVGSRLWLAKSRSCDQILSSYWLLLTASV